MASKLNPDGSDFTKIIHSDTYPAIDPTKANLSGKHVFITGASKGIGRATAISFAKAGASAIAIGARSGLAAVVQEITQAAQEAGKPTPKILPINLDINSRSSVEAAAQEVETTIGRIDILINNAGVLETPTPIIDSDPDVWWNSYTVNVRGPYLVTRSFLPLMLHGDGDKQIFNVASIGAHWTANGLSSYQTGKMALLKLADFINVEYGAQGVLALSIHPGNAWTEVAKHFSEPSDFWCDQPRMAGDVMVHLAREKQEWLRGRYVSCTWDMEELFAKEEDIVKGDLLKVRMAVER